MILTRVKEASKEFIKVLRYGKSDVQTADNVAPHGIDSKPVKEDLAIYAKTRNTEQGIIIGYLQNFSKTKEGETRIFATDSKGNEVFEIYLKNNGDCELGGNKDNAMRYSPTNKGLQDLVLGINEELIKIATGISSAGGAYTPTSQTVDISGAKIENIKTN